MAEKTFIIINILSCFNENIRERNSRCITNIDPILSVDNIKKILNYVAIFVALFFFLVLWNALTSGLGSLFWTGRISYLFCVKLYPTAFCNVYISSFMSLCLLM